MVGKSEAEDHAWRFPGWEISPQQRVLRVDGSPVRVGGRAFDVLWALVQRAGRVAGKSELMDAAWPGLVVEENNLSVQISSLRKVLGSQAIVNVAGRGYKLAALPLAAPVEPPASTEPAPAEAPPPARRTPAGTLIGRDADLGALQHRLGRAPLLSVVGTGGVGKTALTRVLIADAGAAWRDGVHWIDLATQPQGTPLLPLVARALGVMPDGVAISGDVMRALSLLQALIVLDNCEHVLDAVAACVAPLLRAAPGLRWLTTSQEPLALAGEEVYRLAPLDVVPPDAGTERSLACGAMTLFLQRTRSAGHDPIADPAADTAGVAMALDLCRALDGLPLALEMAAARVATLGLPAVHGQLRHRLAMRTGRRDIPGRHHTLHDTYAWSYGLLSEAEQRLFRLLQPFQGGFTAAMVEGVMVASGGWQADDDVALETLRALLAKSLVQRMPADGAGAQSAPVPRFRLLESARDFAAHQLQLAGEVQLAARSHAQTVAEVFANSRDDLLQGRDDEWAARYLPERGNLAAALSWVTLQADEPDLLARLLAAAARCDNFSETQAQIVKVEVPMDVLQRAAAHDRAHACLELGWAHFQEGHREVATALLRQALHDHEACDDLAGVYLALIRLARTLRGRPGLEAEAAAAWQRLCTLDTGQVPLRLRLYCEGSVRRHFDPSTSVEGLRQIANIARHSGFHTLAMICHTNITDQLLQLRRYDDAVQAAEAALAQQATSLGNRVFIDYNLTQALVRLGRHAQAREPARRMLRAAPGQAHMVLDLFAYVAMREQRWSDAALMAGCSARVKHERDWHDEPAEAALVRETQGPLRAALSTTDLQRLQRLGAAMAISDALSIAGLP